MPQYTNSPLGLIMTSESTDSPVIGKYIISGSSSSVSSIFFDQNDSQSFSFNPNAGSSSTYNSDISTIGIINYTSKINAMKLKSSDFAYLKNLGVYPNNRLIVARRFSTPVNDDLTTLTSDIAPVATLVSWVPDNTDFISTSFGEDWVAGDASFREILNELGHDMLMGDNAGKSLGSAVASGGNGVPLPGFTEGLQYEVFRQLKLTNLDASQLPYGNPNIIRESKRRNTAGKEGAWSGLKSKFNVKMVVEYEQKFINGIDPTVVYYDIIANALTFGTSEAQFQFRGSAGDKFNTFLNDIGSGDNNRIKSALVQFVDAISSSLKAIGDAILNALTQVAQALSNPQQIIAGVESLSTKVGNIILTGLVNKYKLRIISVVNSLTGTPSAPWHVTIGNPRRPIFSSGDMVMDKVTITMGKTLAFNDLPSSIKLEFELESARNLGSQEIFKKLNCGRERTYSKQRLSFVETDSSQGSNFPSSSATYSTATGVQNNAVSSGNSTLTNTIQPTTSSVYPTAITGLTNSSNITQNSSTIAQAPVPQLNNQIVQFHPNGNLSDTSGNYLGNWTPTNTGANMNLNSNSTGKQTINLDNLT